jgi:hypothetical protein
MTEWYIIYKQYLIYLYSLPSPNWLVKFRMNILASYIYTDTFYERPGTSAAKYTWCKLILLQYPGVWQRLLLWSVSKVNIFCPRLQSLAERQSIYLVNHYLVV